jgi:hypothetical protein
MLLHARIANAGELDHLASKTMSDCMNCQLRIFRRTSGVWYIENTATRQQESLRTRVEIEAKRLLQARNEAVRQPAINLLIARAYLSAADPVSVSRTWQFVMDEMAKGKHGPTKARWLTGISQKAFDHIRNRKLVETRAEHHWTVLTEGTVSTNIFLRRMHNFALDMIVSILEFTSSYTRFDGGKVFGKRAAS